MISPEGNQGLYSIIDLAAKGSGQRGGNDPDPILQEIQHAGQLFSYFKGKLGGGVNRNNTLLIHQSYISLRL